MMKIISGFLCVLFLFAGDCLVPAGHCMPDRDLVNAGHNLFKKELIVKFRAGYTPEDRKFSDFNTLFGMKEYKRIMPDMYLVIFETEKDIEEIIAYCSEFEEIEYCELNRRVEADAE